MVPEHERIPVPSLELESLNELKSDTNLVSYV